MSARQFVAVAMPQGDASRGLKGPGVMVAVREGAATVDFFFLDRAEAGALRGQLESAEAALLTGERFQRERGAA